MCEQGDDGEDSDEDEESHQQRMRTNQSKSFAKRPRVEQAPAESRAAYNEPEPQARSAASGPPPESGSEDEYKPGQLFIPATTAAQANAPEGQPQPKQEQ